MRIQIIQINGLAIETLIETMLEILIEVLIEILIEFLIEILIEVLIENVQLLSLDCHPINHAVVATVIQKWIELI